MARRPGEFRWTLLPTLASYYVYSYEKENSRSIELRKRVQERFGMPLSGSEMKVDRNMKEAYQIVFGEFDGKVGSNHHDRYVVEHFNDYTLDRLYELFERIMDGSLSVQDRKELTGHAIKVLQTAPRERDMYILTTIEHGLDIRDSIDQIDPKSTFIKEKALEDPEDPEFLDVVNTTVGRNILDAETLQEKSKSISSYVKGEVRRYPRDKSVSWTALHKANHSCEIDSSHETFRRVSNDVDYVEPHHLIPISQQKKYSKSLDVVQNIVSLCPNCHKAIHYAEKETRRDVIEKVFEIKAAELKGHGITLELKDLFRMYNV